VTGNGWFIALASKEGRKFARAAANYAERFQEKSPVQTALERGIVHQTRLERRAMR
jgi:hypothetical protein